MKGKIEAIDDDDKVDGAAKAVDEGAEDPFNHRFFVGG